MSDLSRWLGTDEHYGIHSLERPDAPEAATWSLEAIALIERPHDAVLSPDGKSVAVIIDRDMSDLWLVPVDGGSPSRLTTGREITAYWEDDTPAWSPDGRRVAYTAEGSVWVVAAGGGLPQEVTEGSSPLWVSDSELIITIERDEESRLARTSVDDPWPSAITPRDMNSSGASMGPDRRHVVYVSRPTEERQASEIWIVDLEAGECSLLTGEPGIQDRDPRLAPDGGLVAFTSERSGWNEIYTVEADGQDLRRITDEKGDFSALSWHPDGTKIAAALTRRGRSHLVVVDATTGETQVLREGGEWSPVGWLSPTEIVAIHESHSIPPRLVAVDQEANVRVLFDSAPASVRAATHSPLEEVVYQSFDGSEIHGFLYRPEGLGEGPVPAVIYPHGGPTSAYGDGWDGHAQYFVEKGYAWLAINFRGSTGYGRDFERANFGVWGVRDTEDCLAAADFLAGLDWVDGSRLAIFGASYGSYLALASLARDPEHRFACGVAKYGDSDILTSWAQGDRVGREDLEKMMGRPAESRGEYREGSPLWWAADIERPLLVAHGEQDARVHPDQSSQLVDELRRLEKTYEYITYPTEGHGLLRFVPQVHFYQRLERFLDWYLM